MNVLYWNVCHETAPQTIIEEVGTLVEAAAIDIACLQEVPFHDSTYTSRALGNALGMESVFIQTRTLSSTREGVRAFGTAILSSPGMIEAVSQELRDDTFAYPVPGWGHRRTLLWVQTERRPELTIAVAQLSRPFPLGIDHSRMRLERQNLRDALERQLRLGEVLFGGSMNTPPAAKLDGMLGSIGLRALVTDLPAPSRHRLSRKRNAPSDRVFASPGLTANATIGDRRHSRYSPLIVTVA